MCMPLKLATTRDCGGGVQFNAEPFSGLDPVQMKLLENVIVEFHKKEKGIYIISSHDIECLQNVCDKCLLLHNGQIREINMEEVDREEIAKILSEGE